MPNSATGPGPRRAKVQTQRIGMDQPVYLVRFSSKSGPGSGPRVANRVQGCLARPEVLAQL
ncbi:hypothetical protein [Nodosilinea sp. E11]|uniref:hypothetical protein n=1 Tax=Nodosilinea sp. E11 TaxID=3037479 RepID=UPI002934B58E|nr:hypothetical protein [Nodosilinea sp. E11]WOD39765.1 hypothetical protein RRF56_03015 [Nodosilinea sp. E11]